MAALNTYNLEGAKDILGLDLGTTNLRVFIRHIDAASSLLEPMPLALPYGSREGVVPSVLLVDEKGKMIAYGKEALNLEPESGARIISEFKPCIGQSPDDIIGVTGPSDAPSCPNSNCSFFGAACPNYMMFCSVCGTKLARPKSNSDWAPTFKYSQTQALEYARQLLNAISVRLTDQLGVSLDADAGWIISVGVPVHWGQSTLKLYKDMLSSCFDNSRIIFVPEPSAALRYYGTYGHLRSDNPLNTLVVDCGGGTTDLLYANVGYSEGRLSLESGPKGVYGERYGGSDFDLLLLTYASMMLRVELTPDLAGQWLPKVRAWKEMVSEKIRDKAPGDTKVPVRLNVPDAHDTYKYLAINITLDQFHAVAKDVIARFGELLQKSLATQSFKAKDVQRVVLTGGTSHWNFVEKAVKGAFKGAEVLSGVDPDASIAKGLALIGARESLHQQKVKPIGPDGPKKEGKGVGPDDPTVPVNQILTRAIELESQLSQVSPRTVLVSECLKRTREIQRDAIERRIKVLMISSTPNDPKLLRFTEDLERLSSRFRFFLLTPDDLKPPVANQDSRQAQAVVVALRRAQVISCKKPETVIGRGDEHQPWLFTGDHFRSVSKVHLVFISNDSSDLKSRWTLSDRGKNTAMLQGKIMDGASRTIKDGERADFPPPSTDRPSARLTFFSTAKDRWSPAGLLRNVDVVVAVGKLNPSDLEQLVSCRPTRTDAWALIADFTGLTKPEGSRWPILEDIQLSTDYNDRLKSAVATITKAEEQVGLRQMKALQRIERESEAQARPFEANEP